MVVDIIPYGYPVLPPTPRKKQNLLTSLIPGKRFQNSMNKVPNKLSAVGTVEELFEEGSAMLAERYVFLSTLPNYSKYLPNTMQFPLKLD